MDSETVIAIFTAVGATKLLEPTTQAIGEKIKDNLGKIASKAKAKLESVSLSENVEPNYRVLNAISKEGAFCNDELMAEYFGGVLASSLSEVSRDDRGTFFASIIGALTTYQIRAHYIFYKTLKSLFNGITDVDITNSKHRNRLEIFIDNDSFNLAMDFSIKENVSIILPSVMSGLAKENLIEREFEVISGEKIARCGGNGIIFCPTDLGTELFLRGHGKSDLPVIEFLKLENEFLFETSIHLPKHYKSVYRILKEQQDFSRKFTPTF